MCFYEIRHFILIKYNDLKLYLQVIRVVNNNSAIKKQVKITQNWKVIERHKPIA